MAYTHKIKRTFPSRKPLSVGQRVDASKWVNRHLLERTGFIVPLKPEEIEEVSAELILDDQNSEVVENEISEVVETEIDEIETTEIETDDTGEKGEEKIKGKNNEFQLFVIDEADGVASEFIEQVEETGQVEETDTSAGDVTAKPAAAAAKTVKPKIELLADDTVTSLEKRYVKDDLLKLAKKVKAYGVTKDNNKKEIAEKILATGK